MFNQRPCITVLQIWYIQDAILSYCTLRDVQSFSYVNHDLWNTAKKHILKRLTIAFKHFPFDMPSFLQFLEQNQSIMFGSTVMSVLMPQTGHKTTVDVCVPFYFDTHMVNHVQNLMGSLATDISAEYPRSLFRNVYSVATETSTVQIFIAPTQNVLAPVLSAPSTSAMNFMSGSHIFCAYPDLTFKHTFMLNISTLCSHDPALHVNQFADSIDRVERQGFTLLVSDDLPHANCGTNHHCPLTCRQFKAPHSYSWTFRVAGQPRGDISIMEWVARYTTWCLQRQLIDT